MPTIGLNQQPPKESFWSGRPAYNEQIPLYDQQSQNILAQLLQQGSSGLQGVSPQYQGQNLLTQLLGKLGNNQNSFAPIEQQAKNQFYQETIPTLAERFTSLGTGGSQRSSAFQGTLGQAGAGLSEQIAALKAKYGLEERGLDQNLLGTLQGGQQNQANMYQNALLNMLQFGAQPRFQTVSNPSTPGFNQQAGRAVGTIANAGLNYITGGGYGLANAGVNALNKNQVQPQLA